jgi:crotonobetainyl-CoA:carnitine CoA-transferase CaiB-like acyl-CoA transferase
VTARPGTAVDPGRPPLEGVVILAASQLGAGPWALTLLSDLGADVVKIEPPGQGDEARAVPPFAGDGDSIYFQSLNRGARGLTLDLRSDEGRAVLRRLAPACDAVFDNLRGGEAARLGLDYASLGQVNPRIVCCSLSGFGQTGPRAREPGYDFLVQALAGYMSITGEPGGPPARCGVSVVDFSSGLVAMLGLLVALHRARETGVGCDVDVSLFDTSISMLNYLAAWSLNRGFEPSRTAESAHQTVVPAQAFATLDGHLVVMCMKEKFWRRLCDALGRSDLEADPRFEDFAARDANRDALLAELRPVFASRPTSRWVELLRGVVPCAPVLGVAEALRDPQVEARGMLIEVDHPVYGRLRQTGTPIRMGGGRAPARRAPRLGEHTDEVLSRLGGLSPAEIDGLRRRGVV